MGAARGQVPAEVALFPPTQPSGQPADFSEDSGARVSLQSCKKTPTPSFILWTKMGFYGK